MEQLKIYGVSIPQAVSTVATFITSLGGQERYYSFNTASGKYCCNWTSSSPLINSLSTASFNTASGKYCCNAIIG